MRLKEQKKALQKCAKSLQKRRRKMCREALIGCTFFFFSREKDRLSTVVESEIKSQKNGQYLVVYQRPKYLAEAEYFSVLSLWLRPNVNMQLRSFTANTLSLIHCNSPKTNVNGRNLVTDSKTYFFRS